MKDGLHVWCKSCCTEYAKGYYERRSEVIRARSGQRFLAKKDEILAQNKQRYERDKELILAQQHEYRERNHAHVLERKKEYHQRNRDRILSQRHAHYTANKETYAVQRKLARTPENKAKERECQKRWQAANRERYNFVKGLYRHRKLSAPGTFTNEQILAKIHYHGWRCYLCGVPVTYGPMHIEHRIPLSRGGSNWPANLAPACGTCNVSKGNKTEQEYRAYVQAVEAARPSLISV